MKLVKAIVIFLGTFMLYHIVFSSFFSVDETNVLQAPDWYTPFGLGVALIAAVSSAGKNKPQQQNRIPFLIRILIVVLVLFALFLCAFILSEDDKPNSISTASGKTEGVSTNDSLIIGDSVLIDDKIKVTFVDTQDSSSLGVFYVILRIENTMDTDIAIHLEDADVDGETIPLITTGVPLVIRPGNSGQTAFIFSMVNLSISTMDEAEQATFRVVARDNNSYDVVYKSELVTVDLH